MKIDSIGIRLLLAMISTGAIKGQTASVTLTVNDPRPLAAASDTIEELSGIAVSYEDGQYVNPADLRDVTNEVLTPDQRQQAGPGFHLIVPRGGGLSATIVVDAGSSKIESLGGAQDALLAFTNAHKSSYGQVFSVETGNHVLFIRPQVLKDSAGRDEPTVPVLDTQISFPQAERTAYETLKLVLQSVSQTAGVKVKVGVTPIRAFAESNAIIGAENEAARSVLVRLFQTMTANDSTTLLAVPPNLSYRLFYDRNLNDYALNVHIVPGAMVPQASSLPTPLVPPPVQGQNPFFGRANP